MRQDHIKTIPKPRKGRNSITAQAPGTPAKTAQMTIKPNQEGGGKYGGKGGLLLEPVVLFANALFERKKRNRKTSSIEIT